MAVIEVDMKEFKQAQNDLVHANFRQAWLEVIEAVLRLWEKGSQDKTPVLTGRLRASHQIGQVSASNTSAAGVLHVNAPYAGFVNFGTSTQAPNGFFEKGRQTARRGASKAGSPIVLKYMKGVL